MSTLRLFDISEDYKVKLNREFLYTIPVFRQIIYRDKGSKGDYRGDKKLLAIKDFSFIFHYVDPRSPLDGWEEDERLEQALIYAEKTKVELGCDPELNMALLEYIRLLTNCSPTLRTLRTAQKVLHRLDKYLSEIDFNERDDKGRTIHTPATIMVAVTKLGEYQRNLKSIEQQVLAELNGSTGIRGKADKGDREDPDVQRDSWFEGDSPITVVDTKKATTSNYLELEAHQEQDNVDKEEEEDLWGSEDDYIELG